MTTFTGTSGNDILPLSGLDNSGDDLFYGLAGNDTLNGGGGNDMLDGGTGADRMNGGLGNDLYLVDNAGDIVSEGPWFNVADHDSVQSTISYTLTPYVEDLVLQGSANLNGTGNAQDNAITGNDGANVLSGLAGGDSLFGHGGDDKLYGGDGSDWLRGDAGADTLDGGAGNDQLYGGESNDVLIGGVGWDTLSGGAGQDRFVYQSVADSGDVIFSDSDPDSLSDIIDLGQVDANANVAGNQAFVYLGEGSDFTGAARQLIANYYPSTIHTPGHTAIVGDTNGDRMVDFGIEYHGSMANVDFIL